MFLIFVNIFTGKSIDQQPQYFQRTAGFIAAICKRYHKNIHFPRIKISERNIKLKDFRTIPAVTIYGLSEAFQKKNMDQQLVIR